MLRPAILLARLHRAFIMNKQQLPAGKLVINLWAGSYPFIIVKHAREFLLPKYTIFLTGKPGNFNRLTKNLEANFSKNSSSWTGV